MKVWRLIRSCCKGIYNLFLSENCMIIIPILLVGFFIYIAVWAHIHEEYGNFFNYRCVKADKRAKILDYKLQGKKRCWRLRVRRRSLLRRQERLKKRQILIDKKLENTENILDKYSWDYK